MNLHENNMEFHIQRVLDGLNQAEREKHEAQGYAPVTVDTWKAVEKRLYICLDVGREGISTSGAFMVRKSDGELFNIKSKYGVPDKNKNVKAPLGKIFTVNPAELHARRYNYLPKGRTKK